MKTGLIFTAEIVKNLAQRSRNHNSVWKTELDGFRRKAARRVEAMDGRNQNYNPLYPFFKGELGERIPLQHVPPWRGVLKNRAKMGHHVGYPTVETRFYKFAVQSISSLLILVFQFLLKSNQPVSALHVLNVQGWRHLLFPYHKSVF